MKGLNPKLRHIYQRLEIVVFLREGYSSILKNWK